MLRFATTPDHMSRRAALQLSACGFGYLAFAGLAARAHADEARKDPLAPKPPHFPAKANRQALVQETVGQKSGNAGPEPIQGLALRTGNVLIFYDKGSSLVRTTS